MNRVLNYFILIVSGVLIIGCTVRRSMDVSVAGNNLVTPYGTGDVDLKYKSNTNTEILNGR